MAGIEASRFKGNPDYDFTTMRYLLLNNARRALETDFGEFVLSFTNYADRVEAARLLLAFLLINLPEIIEKEIQFNWSVGEEQKWDESAALISHLDLIDYLFSRIKQALSQQELFELRQEMKTILAANAGIYVQSIEYESSLVSRLQTGMLRLLNRLLD